MIKDQMQYELNQQRQQSLLHEAEQHRLIRKPAKRGSWRRWLPRLSFALAQSPEQPVLGTRGILAASNRTL